MYRYGRGVSLDYHKRLKRGATDPRVSWSGCLRILPEDDQHMFINLVHIRAPTVQLVNGQLSLQPVFSPSESLIPHISKSLLEQTSYTPQVIYQITCVANEQRITLENWILNVASSLFSTHLTTWPMIAAYKHLLQTRPLNIAWAALVLSKIRLMDVGRALRVRGEVESFQDNHIKTNKGLTSLNHQYFQVAPLI